VDALRQPLEDGRVTIMRGQRTLEFPANTIVVAACNRCPCARPADRCSCTALELGRYMRRLSGPLLDRIDVSLTVGRPSAAAMRRQAAPRSADVRAGIVAARERQAARLAGTGLSCNAQLTPRLLRELANATRPAQRRLDAVHDRGHLSARGHGRILRVARTIADLAGSDAVRPEHIDQAASLRLDDRALSAAA
jgi:magnesium chelatase family protein